jgi:hypothetical protein
MCGESGDCMWRDAEASNGGSRTPRVRLRGCTSAGPAGHGLATHSPAKMVQVLVFVNMVQRSRARL